MLFEQGRNEAFNFCFWRLKGGCELARALGSATCGVQNGKDQVVFAGGLMRR